MTKILIVEDHATLRTQLIQVLSLSDYDVVGVADGAEGIQIALEHQPDLILCDIMLGAVSGFDVLQAVRHNAATASTPFIIMSAKDDRTSMRQGMALGADDYITKPFTSSELVKAIETRLERQQAITREAERSLDETRQQLMRMVTHELRTPLTSINMVVDIISRQRQVMDTDQLTELLDTLASGSKRLSRLVDQIVLISQLQSGMMSASTIREAGLQAPLWEIIIAAIGMGRRFAYRNPNVNIDLADRQNDAPVVCNPLALKHALAELITNALNFSPDGGNITISQWASEGAIFVEIIDNGPGIAADQIQRALSHFEQINRQTQEQQGMGLGLGLANQIVTVHGGSLTLQSAPGKGTRAVVALPIAVGAYV
jgi:signal transduction histidine kinase